MGFNKKLSIWLHQVKFKFTWQYAIQLYTATKKVYLTRKCFCCSPSRHLSTYFSCKLFDMGRGVTSYKLNVSTSNAFALVCFSIVVSQMAELHSRDKIKQCTLSNFQRSDLQGNSSMNNEQWTCLCGLLQVISQDELICHIFSFTKRPYKEEKLVLVWFVSAF